MAPQVLLFGLPRVQAQGAIETLPLVRPTYLLLYLALRGDWVSREELTQVLRTQDHEPSTLGSLRLLLARARRMGDSSSLTVDLEADSRRLRWLIDSDVTQFRRALADERWGDAALAYPEPLLQGLPTHELPGFQPWLEAERAALHAQWLVAVGHQEAALLTNGGASDAAHLLQRALYHDPLSEALLQRYMHARLEAGQRGEALRAYSQFGESLKRELGLSPLAATVALAERVRSGNVLRPVPLQAKKRLPESLTRPPRLVVRPVQQLLRDAQQTMVLLSGQPGSGKTRLLTETWPQGHWLRCAEERQQQPYFPLLQAAMASDEESARLVQGLVASARPGAQSIPNTGGPELSGEFSKDRLFQMFDRVLTRGAPLLVDDLQWADPGTLDWLYSRVKQGMRVRGAVRSGEDHPALNELMVNLGSELQVISLEPMNRGELAVLTADLAPMPKAQDTFDDWLYRNSGGNPLFALEWLRTLIEDGVYEVHGGQWQQTGGPLDLDRIRLAPALSDLVLRRAHGLSLADQRVLDLGSVLGRALTPERLGRVLGLSAWEMSDAQARASWRGLLQPDGTLHDVVRRAVYEAMSPARRRFLHGQVARLLAGDLDDLQLAEHALSSGDEETAARLWFGVARFAFGVRQGFEAEASALYRRVLTLHLRSAWWYRACAYLAVRERVDDHAEEARRLIETVVRESDDPHARTMARAEGATLAYLAGDLSESSRLIELAEREAVTLDDPGMTRDLLQTQVNIAHYLGDYETALKLAAGVVEQQRSEPVSYSTCTWRSALAANLCAVGRFEEALGHYREQLEAARFLGLKGQQVTASSDIIATLHDLGRIQEGLALAEEALTLGQFNDTYPLRYHIALANTRSGRHREALMHLKEVLSSRSVNMRAHAHALLAEVHAALGNQTATQGALKDGLLLVEPCDVLTARAVVAIAVLQFGEPRTLVLAQALIDSVDPEGLPAYLKGDFEQALEARPASPTRSRAGD